MGDRGGSRHFGRGYHKLEGVAVTLVRVVAETLVGDRGSKAFDRGGSRDFDEEGG